MAKKKIRYWVECKMKSSLTYGRKKTIWKGHAIPTWTLKDAKEWMKWIERQKDMKNPKISKVF